MKRFKDYLQADRDRRDESTGMGTGTPPGTTQKSSDTSPTTLNSAPTTPAAQNSTTTAPTPAIQSKSDPYQDLMKQLSQGEEEQYGRTRDVYKQNARRNQMMANASLIGDLAHLGMQTVTATKPFGNYAMNKIQPDDKYLGAAQKWKEQIGQSYIDEVSAKNKQKREIMLQKLKDDAARERYEKMYGYRDGYYSGKEENERTIAEARAARERAAADKYASDAENKTKQTDATIADRERRTDIYAGSVANQNANRNARTTQNSNSDKEVKNMTETEVRDIYAGIPDEYKIKKLEEDADYEKRWVPDNSLSAVRQSVSNWRNANKGSNTSGKKDASLLGLTGKDKKDNKDLTDL